MADKKIRVLLSELEMLALLATIADLKSNCGKAAKDTDLMHRLGALDKVAARMARAIMAIRRKNRKIENELQST